jgi:hypothetical protein
MLQIHVTIFVLISACSAIVAYGQDPGTEPPLQKFLSSLSNPEIAKLPLKFSRKNEIDGQYRGFYWSQGKFGISTTVDIERATERRTIWNCDYATQIERVNQGKWTCVGANDSNTDAYEELLGNVNHAGFFFGGGIYRRFQFLESVGVTKQPEGLLYEYRYVSDSPLYSIDPVINSLSFLFDEKSDEPRLLEIRHCDGGGEIKVLSITKFDYADGFLFPLKRIANGVVKGGKMDGKKLVAEEVIEIDDQAKFDSAECYLSHYGLPEPIFPSNGSTFNQPIIWIVVVILLIGIFVFLGPRFSRARVDMR